MKIAVPVIIIIAIVSGALYYFVFTGILKVTSLRPPSAMVQIDGLEAGITPLKQRVRLGSHQIKVYKEGFEPWQGEARVSPFSPATVSVKLRFLLRSDPSGAKVVINGKDIGTTDMPIDLAPGIYTFELRKKGYRTAKFIANIPPDAGQALPVAELVPAKAPLREEEVVVEKPSPPEYGSIQITSTPDAQVYLDGNLQGETPLSLSKIPVGSYVLKLSKEGYRDLRQTVYVEKGETTKVAAELKPEPPD